MDTDVVRVRVVRAEDEDWYANLVPIVLTVCDLGNKHYVLWPVVNRPWLTIKKSHCEKWAHPQ